jgi:VIT1/CCC1 family predicted Fe2+/Mn2+ transporter
MERAQHDRTAHRQGEVGISPAAGVSRSSEEASAVRDDPDGRASVRGQSVSWSELQRRHRAVTSNTVRAGVLGANDGLVSNLSLVAGVAGAALASRIVFITGLAGLVAGAGAMAMGEWISVQTAREMHTRELEVEAEELERFPLEETDELARLYERRGLPTDGARSLAESVMKNPATALEVMAREELGIDSHQLSPYKAAASSALLFCLGAIVPLIPFAITSGTRALVTSLVASALALFVLGALVTRLTGRSPIRSGLRQVIFGLSAATVTYGIGLAVGLAVR